MLYRIVNPSDSYTIECQDLEVATIACCLLGGGQYGFEPLEAGAPEVPLFLFGGVADFCRQHFSAEFEDVMQRVKEQRTDALADALDSVLIGRSAEGRRRFYEAAPSERGAFLVYRLAYHDEKRSSTNDIGRRAYHMAIKFRERAAQPVVPAPRQVFGA